MTQQSGETALIGAIKTQLDNQFKGKPPPLSEDDGLQRIANAVGTAVIDTLGTELVVTITIGTTPYTGTITWH